MKEIQKYEELLKSNSKLVKLISKDLKQLKIDHNSSRRTVLGQKTITKIKNTEKTLDVVQEISIIKQEAVLLFDNENRIKALFPDAFKSGIKRELLNNNIKFAIQSDEDILIITEKKYHIINVNNLLKGGRFSSLSDFISDFEGNVVAVMELDKTKDLFIVTDDNRAKRISLDIMLKVKNNSLVENVNIIGAVLCIDDNNILISTKKSSVRKVSAKLLSTKEHSSFRKVRGNTIYKPDKGDEIIAVDLISSNESVVTVTENGFVKKTTEDKYTLRQTLAGKGMLLAGINIDTGDIVLSKPMKEGNYLSILTDKNKRYCLSFDQVHEKNRSSKGKQIIEKNEIIKFTTVVS